MIDLEHLEWRLALNFSLIFVPQKVKTSFSFLNLSNFDLEQLLDSEHLKFIIVFSWKPYDFKSPIQNFAFLFQQLLFQIKTAFSFSQSFVFEPFPVLPFCFWKAIHTASFLCCIVKILSATSKVLANHHIIVPLSIK